MCNFVVFSGVEICVDYGGLSCLICALIMALGFVLMFEM